MTDLNIEELRLINTSFSQTQCNFLSENCIIALEVNNHSTGCILTVKGEQTVTFKLIWAKQFSRSGYKEPRKITEKAAEAISFFLTRHLTEYSILEEALIGSGVDYWLGYDDSHPLYDPLNFIQARLEISGIDKETADNNLDRRYRKKKSQTLRSDGTNLPVYVSIVEFSTPKAIFVKR